MKTFSKIKFLNNLLITKQISCVELTKNYLDAIEKTNKLLSAYVKITDVTALDTAREVDKKIARGEALSPLEGIPMTLKDNISTQDIETTCCSKMLKGYVPIYDATVWEILKKCNAVLLGKTNMDEFAMGSTCETSYFGGALNPHDTSCVAGGSSGGVASAVAGNIAVYGLGSDTGGSIRQPASFCGIVGLKPTYGAVSRYGLIAYASSFDQIGPITVCVEDAAIVFDVISRHDKKDPTSVGLEAKAGQALENSIKGLRIGLPKEYLEGLSEDVKKCIYQAIKVYEDLGAQIVQLDMPVLEYSLPVYYILTCAEASSNLGRYDGIRYGYKVPGYSDLDDLICRTRSEAFGREVKRRILLGTYVLSSGNYDEYYKKAQRVRCLIIKAFKEAFRECDVIVAPTVPTTAFKKNSTANNPMETYKTEICTVSVNIAGLPSVSIPCGFDTKGLPIGMQIIGDSFQDSKILNVAHQYEMHTFNEIYKELEIGVRL